MIINLTIGTLLIYAVDDHCRRRMKLVIADHGGHTKHVA